MAIGCAILGGTKGYSAPSLLSTVCSLQCWLCLSPLQVVHSSARLPFLQPLARTLSGAPLRPTRDEDAPKARAFAQGLGVGWECTRDSLLLPPSRQHAPKPAHPLLLSSFPPISKMQSMALSMGGPSPAGHPDSLQTTILGAVVVSGAAGEVMASLACMALAPRQSFNLVFGPSGTAPAANAGDTAQAIGDTSRGDVAAASTAGADVAPANGCALPSSSHQAKQIAGDLAALPFGMM